ncbi:MAG: hypothetical protein AAB518_03635 [Patescibacteria group bacterium]
MFIADWVLFVIGLAFLFIILWVVRLYRHLHRMRRIIRRLEAIEDKELHYDKAGDSE